MNPGMDYTRDVAFWCSWDMYRFGFKPASIISAGVGSAPEMYIWRWLFPNIPILAVDPKPLMAKFTRGDWSQLTFVQSAVGDGNSSSAYLCRDCVSLVCKDQSSHQSRGRWSETPVSTLDKLAEKFPSPYFVWMDIEGYELRALRGASAMLSKTDWLCVELTNWVPRHKKKVTAFLESSGFVLRRKFDHDGLFSKPIKRGRRTRGLTR